MEIDKDRVEYKDREKNTKRPIECLDRLFHFMVHLFWQHALSRLHSPLLCYFQGTPLHFTAHEETPLTFRQPPSAAGQLLNTAHSVYPTGTKPIPILFLFPNCFY